MITKLENIRNEFLYKQYKDMIDSMYEEVGSAKWGVRTKIKTKKISLIDYKTFNFFGMYHKEIYKLYLEISKIIKEECKKNKINFENNYYYLLGNLLDQSVNNFLVTTPDRTRLNFSGIYVIKSNNNKMIINEKEIDTPEGTLILFDKGDIIDFCDTINKDSMFLYFSVSTLQNLHRQYYQKWIPLV